MWHKDILGDPWVALTVPLAPIRGHETVATVVSQPRWLTRPDGSSIADEQADSHSSVHLPARSVRAESRVDTASAETGVGTSRPRPETTAVLYIHGLNDYFFHEHLAEYLAEQGVAFFALDLHGFGRSITDEITRNDAFSLREYGNDLAAATTLIKDECGYQNLVILAHSTGGLIASLWAHSQTGRETVDGLILNSPWFDLNRPWLDRTIGTAFVDAVGEYVTDFVLNNDESNYVRMLHRDIAGDWDFDLNLKREINSPVRTGFFRAVRAGQARLAEGLDLNCPVLVCTSDRSGHPGDPLPLKRSSDVVLNVEQIIRRAPLLGRDVEIVQIPGGIHDLALSEYGPRIDYFKALGHWLRAHRFAGPPLVGYELHSLPFR
ncbi:alpha/beta hydrolase [Populibacterium corticicola]|uniref:Alpha/beta hydrolase n=1 Tax=Populibacterium corticicola TaxID=1812826 RepID=A0ABW5XHJ4_9MICO